MRQGSIPSVSSCPEFKSFCTGPGFWLRPSRSGARQGRYSSLAWNALEYLALFAIVLMHEFGHALACRQVGGKADTIMLWPLGGVAYVSPPSRPGAMLWSLAAGPLVNVALMPLLYAAVLASGSLGLAQTMPDAYQLIKTVFDINVVLLAFNILPIYPLDGGQILRSLLWYVVGRARSLAAATVLGIVGAAGFIGLAVCGALRLVVADCGIHALELLLRAEGRAGANAQRKAPAPPGVRLPKLRGGARRGKSLEMSAMPPGLRHIRNRGGLPAMRVSVLHNHVPGVPAASPDQRVGRQLLRQPDRRRRRFAGTAAVKRSSFAHAMKQAQK